MLSYQFAQFYFDVSKGSLAFKQDGENKEIQLRHKVANLLTYLIEHRSRIVSKEELLSKLWQHGDYRENSLTQSIRELRSALGDNARNPNFIKTYPQRGYQWIAHINVPDSGAIDSTKVHSILSDYKIWGIIVVLIVSCIAWYVSINDVPLRQNSTTTAVETVNDVQSLLVLPFINATNKQSMAWLELGLADMLAVDMQRGNQLRVTPPAIAHTLLLEAQLPWPTLPVHIRTLLNEHQIQVALFASVRLHDDNQILDFQLIYANGKVKQGSISYPSLPGAALSIKQQLLHLLMPSHKKQPLADENPIEALALAKGMQALQKEGPLQAQKYFKASLSITQTSQWARAYLAQSLFTLGDWQAAEQLFAQIPVADLAADHSLAAFIDYWRAELAFRRGDDDVRAQVDAAVSKAELSVDSTQMALSYRLQAKIAWQQRDWNSHQRWLTKAEQLFGVKNNLSIEADKMFYLGSLSNEGLEKNPNNDLALNQQYLLKALNFYQQLGNQSMIAASQFAIAQNYTFTLQAREQALTQAINIYRQLQHPYELALALTYAGFYQMQLHDGRAAEVYFTQAKSIAVELGSKQLIMDSDFYLAFASLDQGLDQRALGLHGKDDKQLAQAISQLERFIQAKSDPTMTASALVFLGWANTDLGNFDLALNQLVQAKTLNDQYKMQVTSGYSSYSIMRIHLERGDYHAVIKMKNEPITTRLQASYLARAFFELNKITKAIEVLQNLQQQLPLQWQSTDQQRLAIYQRALEGEQFNLGAEPKAHLTYCESDWLL